MSWIKKFLTLAHDAQPADWTFIDSINGPAKSDPDLVIKPDECYIELYVDSFKLGQQRKFANTFDGVVYAFIQTSRAGQVPAKLSAVTKPTEITDIGAADLNDVITINKRLFKVIPWRGNPLDLELGLFSVKSGNVASKIADYVVRLSNTFTPGITTTIDPFLPLVSEGLDLLAGQTDDVELELAIDTSLNLTQNNLYALIRMPSADIDRTKVSLSDNGDLLYDGQKIEASYCLFSVRPRKGNPDWGEIETIGAGFTDLKNAIVSGKNKEASEALASFRRLVLVCPDLIYTDQMKIIELANELVENAFSGGLIAGDTECSHIASMRLSDLKLYQ